MPDIFFSLLLAQHTHEQLSICGRKTNRILDGWTTPFAHINITNAGAIPFNRRLILTLKVRAQELAINDIAGGIWLLGGRVIQEEGGSEQSNPTCLLTKKYRLPVMLFISLLILK